MILLRLSFSFVMMLFAVISSAQQPDFQNLPDGYYTDHVEILGGKPAVLATQLYNKAGVKLTSFNPENEKHFLQTSDDLVEVKKDAYLGFVRNGIFYLNFKGGYYRLGITGMLSHVMVVQTVYNNMDGFTGSYATEQVSLVIDFKTGNMFAFEPEPFQAFLTENDPALYQEFAAMKKRKDKKRALFVFLRRYNEQYKK
jgi:hypothetical protein